MTYTISKETKEFLEEKLQDELLFTKHMPDEQERAYTMLKEIENPVYIVQELDNYDVQMATGKEDLQYSDEQMELLREHMEETTYNGDDWCTEINRFNDEL